MAQKAVKALAARNAASLRRIHLISLGVHMFYMLLRFGWRRDLGSKAIVPYVLFSLVAGAIQALFELNSRPKHNAAGDITRAGDDLEAKGLTEYLFDVLYWTWGTIVCAAVLGRRAWWLWTVVPIYSAWAAYTTFGGVKESLAGLQGAGGEGPVSNRQKKLEKRGGPRVQYR